MQSKIQLPHALIPPAPVPADHGTEALQSSALNEGMHVSEFFAIPDVCPGSLLRTGETVARITSSDAAPSENIQPNPWWHAIPDALSWVKNFLIEGFAAYAAAMDPGYFYPYETDHSGWCVPDNLLPKTRRDREVVASSIDPADVSPVRASQAAALCRSGWSDHDQAERSGESDSAGYWIPGLTAVRLITEQIQLVIVHISNRGKILGTVADQAGRIFALT